ncbi:hypothetical protein AAKU67_000718 [Oxalobacteraceae bacterium GrIS 2.11]
MPVPVAQSMNVSIVNPARMARTMPGRAGPSTKTDPDLPCTGELEVLPAPAECKAKPALADFHAQRLRAKILAGNPARQAPVAVAPPKNLSTPSQSSPVMKRGQALDLIKKIYLVLQSELDNQQLMLCMAEIIELLCQSDNPVISVEEWAGLSLRFDALHAMVEQVQDKAAAAIPRLHFIAENIASLKKVSRYVWTQLAYDGIVQQFADDIEQELLDNPVMLNDKSVKGKLDISTPIPLLSGGVELGYRDCYYVNEDGERVRANAVTGGASLKASFFGVASIKATGTGTTGKNEYCKTPREDAIHRFDTLLANNRHRPEIARYLSRRATLGLPFGDPDEVREIHERRTKYLLHEKRDSQRFSVLLSLNYDAMPVQCEPEIKLADESPRAPARIKLRTVVDKKVRPTESNVTAQTAKAEAELGGQLQALQLKMGMSASYSRRSTTTRSHRTATFCELFKNSHARPDIKEALARRLEQATRSVRTSWYPDSLPGDGDKLLQENIRRLHRDFTFYCKLHASCMSRVDLSNDPAHASIKAFHRQFKVASGDQCVLKMAQLTALFLYRLQQAPATLENQQLMDDLQKLETALHASGIPQQADYLEKHALAKQPYAYDSEETVVKFTASLDLPGMSVDADLGVRISILDNGGSRNLRDPENTRGAYYNCWHTGKNARVEFRIGSDQGVNERVLKALEMYFKSSAPEISRYFASASFDKPGYYAAHFLKPARFPQLGYRLLVEQELDYHSVEIGGSIPMPPPLPVKTSVGLSFSDTQRQFNRARPSSETMFYFIQHYAMARAAGKIDESGKQVQESYWSRMVRDNPDALKQLCHNFVQPGPVSRALLLELNEIERVLLKSASPEERAKIVQCRQEFCAKAKQCSSNYPEALAALEQLFNAYFPHYARDKENSSAYRAWRFE